jgi:hypothetical protein
MIYLVKPSSGEIQWTFPLAVLPFARNLGRKAKECTVWKMNGKTKRFNRQSLM